MTSSAAGGSSTEACYFLVTLPPPGGGGGGGGGEGARCGEGWRPPFFSKPSPETSLVSIVARCFGDTRWSWRWRTWL